MLSCDKDVWYGLLKNDISKTEFRDLNTVNRSLEFVNFLNDDIKVKGIIYKEGD